MNNGVALPLLEDYVREAGAVQSANFTLRWVLGRVEENLERSVRRLEELAGNLGVIGDTMGMTLETEANCLRALLNFVKEAQK